MFDNFLSLKLKKKKTKRKRKRQRVEEEGRRLVAPQHSALKMFNGLQGGDHAGHLWL